MGKSKDQFLHLRQSRKEQRHYSVQDVINAEINLEPLECVNCSSTEVTYHQYVGDAYCSDCGIWQGDIHPMTIQEIKSIKMGTILTWNPVNPSSLLVVNS